MSDWALISPEALEDKPIVSRHDSPQPMPQEYDCGCLTSVYITPYAFEMRLARAGGAFDDELNWPASTQPRGQERDRGA